MPKPLEQIWYRTKNAFKLEFIKPRPAEEGKYYERSGGYMLTVAPSVGTRKYDWEKTIKFYLSPSEITKIEVARLKRTSVDLFHDPNKKSAKEGTITKRLKFEPTEDGKGYKFSIGMTNNGEKTYQVFILSVDEFMLFMKLTLGSIGEAYGWG